MTRTPPAWRIWVAAVTGAVVLDSMFAFRQLWLQPRQDAGTVVWWVRDPLELLTYGLLVGATVVPLRVAGRDVRPPQSFVVEPGRFVVPPAPWLRVVAIQAALASWGAVPVFVLSWRIVVPGSTGTGMGVFGVLLALLATVVAWRVRHRTVTLTPEGIAVREVWDSEVELPWDRAGFENFADRLPLRWVDTAFITRVVDHYWSRPEHRAAIGTPEEYDRLTTLLTHPDPAAPATPDQ